MRAARLLILALVVAAVLAVPAAAAAASSSASASSARKLLQGLQAGTWPGGPAYADAGRGTFAYSGVVGMPGSPSVIRPPGFFIPSFWGWGKRR